jgi:hypothetical protein
MILGLVFALVVAAFQQGGSAEPQTAMQQRAHGEYEQHKQATVAQLMWARGHQTIWTMPNEYALGPDGTVADGCRALEALRVIHDLDGLFQNLRGARDRLRSGRVPSEEIKKRLGEPNPQAHDTVRLEAHEDTNPIRPAERRYVQEHGPEAYAVACTLFEELFPTE